MAPRNQARRLSDVGSHRRRQGVPHQPAQPRLDGRLSDVAADLRKLPVKSAWFEGEVVALRPNGVTDFGALQSSFRKRQTSQLTYWLFDLLYLDGCDLRGMR